jgi:hypothetical protein
MEFKSITKSSYLEEGLEALRIAKTVETVEELMKKYTINQNSDYSRETCWWQVKKRFFNIDKNKIIKTPLLKLIDFTDEKLNKELMYYSYLHQEPMALETVLKYIYPRLSSEESCKIERKNLILFLKKYISKYSEATIIKTANSIRKALIDFGIARAEDGEAVFTYYDTSLYSFLYGLYAEYSPGYEPANRFNILNPSMVHIQKKAHFYKLFFIKPSLLRTYLNLGWEKDYLDYEPRGGLDQYVLKYKSLDGFVNNLIKGDHHE